MKKEILVYSPGDPSDVSIWSNVPYFFCRSLEQQNVKIDKVDISIKNNIFNFPVREYSKIKRKILQKKYGKDIVYGFYRNEYYDKVTLFKMQNGERKYPKANVQVIFDFSHAIKNGKPLIMLCDWTIEYYIKEHLKRSPNNYEQKLIRRQYDMMRQSDAIVSIFPRSYDQIKKYFPDKTYYLGHIVNSLEKYKDNRTTQYKKKNVLFIGGPKYIKGLVFLIKAINNYNSYCQNDEKLTLNVIGITKAQIKINLNTDFCNFYGYLNKTILEDREKYYNILSNSRVIVNPTANWNGASSLFESLYLGVPIIVSPNIELKALMKEKSFCNFCDPRSIKSLEEKLKLTFSETFEVFAHKSLEAHRFADQYTWDKFAKKFINLVNSLN